MAGGMALSLGNLEVHLLGDNSKLAQMLRDTDTRMNAISKSFKKVGMSMTKYVTLPMTVAGTASLKFFSDFDDKMTQSVAIMGTNGKEFRKQMEETAKTLSTTSIQAANQLAESYFFLASAGLDAKQSMAALPVVTSFATAGMFDMALATDLLTDAQSALGLTVDDSATNMKNMTRVGDVLVKANTLANASVEQFSVALTSKAGTAMKSYNIDLEEGVAVLAAYADQGIKAEYAGNMFDRMLRLTIKSVNDNEEAWKQWGIETKDTEGNLLPIADILQGINEKTQDLGSTQKAAALEMLGFEARSQQAILPLLGLDQNIRKYEESLKKAGGITKEVSDIQLTSFASQMKIVWNNVKLAGIEIGQILAPYVRWLGEEVKGLTIWFRELNATQQKWIIGLSASAAAIGPILIGAAIFASLISNMIRLIGPFIKLLKGAWVVVTKLAGAFKLLFKVVIGGLKMVFKLALGLLKALLPYAAFITVFMAIGLAVWVIADALTGANLKVLDFIRSFKVAGTSIGAWWDALGTFLWQSWDYSISKISHFFKAMWEGAKEGGRMLWRGLLEVAKGIDEAFWKAAKSVINAQASIIYATSEALMYGGDATSELVGKMQEAAAKMKSKANQSAASNSAFYQKQIDKSYEDSQKSAEEYYNGVEKLEADYTKNAEKWAKTRSDIFGKDDTTTTKAASAAAPPNPEANPFVIDMKAINEMIEGLMAERNDIIATEQEKGGLSEIEREKNKNAALLLLSKQKTDDEIALQKERNNVAVSGTASLFGALAQIAEMGGKKQFKTFKAFALAEATISAYQAFNNALGQAPWPYNAAAAAAALATGFIQVRKIAMMQPGGGGGAGGSGGGGGGVGGGFTATPAGGGAGDQTMDPEDRKLNHTTIIIENVHGSADEQFADMLADKIADRSGDGRTYGFATTS